MRTWATISILLAAATLLVPSPASAQASYWQAYDAGVDALDREDWPAAIDNLMDAINALPDEGYIPYTGVQRRDYLPYFQLGRAYAGLGDCTSALAAWAESERQGEIQDTDRYDDLVSGRTSCQESLDQLQTAVQEAQAEIDRAAGLRDRLVDLLATDSDADAAWGGDAGLESRRQRAAERLDEANRLLQSATDTEILDSARSDAGDALELAGDATRMYGDLLTDAEAARDRYRRQREDQETAPTEGPEQPAQQDDPSATGAAAGTDPPDPAAGDETGGTDTTPARPEDEAGGEPISTGAGIDDSGEDDPDDPEASAGDRPVEPTEPTPSPALVTAIDAYFTGDYRGALDDLDSLSAPDERARLHASFFRAAAQWALWARAGGNDPALLDAVESELTACRRIDPDFEPPREFFSPRFLALFDAAGS